MATVSLQHRNTFPSLLTMTRMALCGWHLLPAEFPSDDPPPPRPRLSHPISAPWRLTGPQLHQARSHLRAFAGSARPTAAGSTGRTALFSSGLCIAVQPVYTLSTVRHSVSLSPGHLHLPPKHLAYDGSVWDSVACTIPRTCCWQAT